VRLVVGLSIAAGFAGAAQAATLEWTGSLIVSLGVGGAPFVSTGTGVATVNGSGGLGHLSTLRVAGGISGATTVPVTDPDLPSIVDVALSARLGTGTLAPISGGGPLVAPDRTLPITGTAVVGVHVLSLFTTPVVIPLTLNGTRGIGIGGGTISGGLGIALQGNPWTLGVAQTTTSLGGLTSLSGFVHAPASNTSSTAQVSGVVQVVTPSLVSSSVSGTSTPVLSALRLRFVPEPGRLLMLGSAVLGLLGLARRRRRSESRTREKLP
jgi:hypothetical protein